LVPLSSRQFSIFILVIVTLFVQCKPGHKTDTLFSLVPASKSGIHFNNKLTFTEDYNPYIFKNFLSGGGVAAGDINNDGLCDLFFSGNMVSNKLYLNKGNLTFEDITNSSGTESKGVWSTGVSMADVNGDGWLDIYVCKSGKPGGEKRHNELFLNNGNLTFRDVSHQAGLDAVGLSTQAVFFDYDLDGDLDCYLLNNSIRSVGTYDLIRDSRLVRDTSGGNKLYENLLIQFDDGTIVRDSFPHFKDVSEKAGIYGSSIGFGLGVTVADLNGDHWPDLYVSNDFFERDYLYINQRNGSFTECLPQSMQETSKGSMGADIADLDEDGWPEIFVTEMLPKDPVRYKTKAAFDNWPLYQESFSKGYHRQFGRNVLQLHRGLGPDSLPYFSEIGRFEGVDATEWSWGALLADFNNDGLKDIFVANGIFKDLIDLDYVNFYFNPEAVRALIKSKKEVITTMFDAAESVPFPNQLFLQDTAFHFRESATETGLDIPTFSNGSAYADLDNDGDLELIINNVNMPGMIFQNHATEMGQHYLRIHLKNTGANTGAIGTKVIVYACGHSHRLENYPMRGFQSTVDQVLSVGLGNCTDIDSIVVLWPYGKQSMLTDVHADTTIILNSEIASRPWPHVNHSISPLLVKQDIVLPFRHQENRYSDFDRDRLMFTMISNEGPRAAIKDLDGDGLEDIVIGGALGESSAILFQEHNSTFKKVIPSDMHLDSLSEDISIRLVDVNCDAKPDIYITSGSSELPLSSSAMRDRLYLNHGHRDFSRAPDFYHASFESHHAVCISDFDQDHDADLVTFGRSVPFAYGVPPQHTLYLNERCKSWKALHEADDMFKPGMVTSAISADVDSDGDDDILAAYEYGPIRIYINEKGMFSDKSSLMGFEHISGLWHHILASDIDRDGDIDIIASNHGLNSRIKADTSAPMVLYINDFDRNGQTEQILCRRKNGLDYPIALKDDLLKQLPYLNKKYTTYAAFANATIQDMFDPEQIKQSILYTITELRSGIFYNDKGKFEFTPLPDEAQWTIQYCSWTGDINGDQRPDIILGGNQYSSKPEMGIYAGSFGTVLIQQDDGSFMPVSMQESGLFEIGSIRDIQLIHIGNQPKLLIVKNNDVPVIYAMPFYTTEKNISTYQ